MAKAELTTEEMGILKRALANPAIVEEWLDEMQYTACAGLIRFPELVSLATAHIFASDNPLYGEVYRAVRAGARGLDKVYIAVSRRQGNMDSALPLAEMSWHPVTRWRAEAAIRQLQKFVAWQYRQEKARRVAA